VTQPRAAVAAGPGEAASPLFSHQGASGSPGGGGEMSRPDAALPLPLDPAGVEQC